MSRSAAPRHLACLAWLACAGMLPAWAADPPSQYPAFETQGQAQRMRTQPSAPHALGFIDTQAPHCLQPDRTLDQCYINFYYNGVVSDQFVTTFTIALDGRPVAGAYGFFQSSFSLPRKTLGDRGLAVACGIPGASDDPDPAIGLRYAYTIRARDSAAQTSANYGVIGCPAYVPDLMLRDGFENPLP